MQYLSLKRWAAPQLGYGPRATDVDSSEPQLMEKIHGVSLPNFKEWGKNCGNISFQRAQFLVDDALTRTIG